MFLDNRFRISSQIGLLHINSNIYYKYVSCKSDLKKRNFDIQQYTTVQMGRTPRPSTNNCFLNTYKAKETMNTITNYQ